MPGVLVGRSLILENMAVQHGKEDKDKVRGREWLQASFYPQSTKWRASIIQRGVALLLQAVEYSSKNNKNNNILEEKDLYKILQVSRYVYDIFTFYIFIGRL